MLSDLICSRSIFVFKCLCIRVVKLALKNLLDMQKDFAHVQYPKLAVFVDAFHLLILLGKGHVVSADSLEQVAVSLLP